jgi:hypothetical protein
MMRNACLLAAIVFCQQHTLRAAHAYDAFSDRRSPPHFVLEAANGSKLVFKGWLGLSLRDLEGSGGPGHDSITDTATIGTRSPHAALDGAQMALRLQTPSKLNVFSVYTFTQDDARLESAWLDHRIKLVEGLYSHSELGLHAPFVKRDPMSAREPILSLIYWGTPEAHLTTELMGRWNRWRGRVGLSLAMMRPLETQAINTAANGRGVISILGYGRARPLSGNAPVIGTKLGIGWAGFAVESFGYRGHLSAEGGIDELRNRMAHFVHLPGFDARDPRRQDPTFWWWGGRFRFKDPTFRLLVEGVRSRESLIGRWALSVEAGYVWRASGKLPGRTFEVGLRGERYRIENGGRITSAGVSLRSPDPSQALTWDYDTVSVLFASQLVPKTIWLRAEHTIIHETNSAPSPGRVNAPFPNDETTLGFEVRY